MKGSNRELASCGQCIKYIMFAMNIVFFLIGGTIMGVGIWIIVDRNFMSVILGTDLMTVAAYLIIVGGGVVFLIAFMGCLGAILESKSLLLIYFIVLSTIFLMLLVGGILAIVFRTEIKEGIVQPIMRESIRDHYGVDLEIEYNRMMTQAWDDAQETLYCCAVEDQSWSLYKGSEWYKIQPGVPEKDKPYVPQTCCVRNQYKEYVDLQKCQNWMLGPPAKTGGELNEALFYRGCYTAGYDFVMEYSGYLIGMAIGVAVALIAGIVFSLMLYRMI